MIQMIMQLPQLRIPSSITIYFATGDAWWVDDALRSDAVRCGRQGFPSTPLL